MLLQEGGGGRGTGCMPPASLRDLKPSKTIAFEVKTQSFKGSTRGLFDFSRYFYSLRIKIAKLMMKIMMTVMIISI